MFITPANELGIFLTGSVRAVKQATDYFGLIGPSPLKDAILASYTKSWSLGPTNAENQLNKAANLANVSGNLPASIQAVSDGQNSMARAIDLTNSETGVLSGIMSDDPSANTMNAEAINTL